MLENTVWHLRKQPTHYKRKASFPKKLQWVTSRWVTYDPHIVFLILGACAVVAFAILTGLGIEDNAARTLAVAATAIPPLVRKVNVGLVAYAAVKAQSACRQADIPFDETSQLLGEKEKLESALNDLKGINDQSELEINSFKQQIDRLNGDKSSLTEQNKELSENIKELESKLDKERKQSTQEQETLNKKINTLKKQLVELKKNLSRVKRTEVSKQSTLMPSSTSAGFFHASSSASPTTSTELEGEQTEYQQADKEKKEQDSTDNSPLPIPSDEERMNRTNIASPSTVALTPSNEELRRYFMEHDIPVLSLKKGK